MDKKVPELRVECGQLWKAGPGTGDCLGHSDHPSCV